jgi:phosphoglycolate phosphatase-like HAD superfamily hydrolase
MLPTLENVKSRGFQTAEIIAAEENWPMNRSIKGIVFDLDGTLIHTKTDFRKMKTRMIEYLVSQGVDGSQLSTTETNIVLLAKSDKMLRNKSVPQDKIVEIMEQVEEIMNETELESVAETKPILGAEEALKELKRQGYRTVILTRGHHHYAVEALKNTGLMSYFDFVLGREETPKPKPEPEALEHAAKVLNLGIDEVVFVGDHTIDQTCALRAKARFIGVLTGTAKAQTWMEAGCQEVLAGVVELPAYLEKKG